MTRCLAGVFAAIWTLAAGSAYATSFGGDDSGNIPPDAATYKVEAKIDKTLTKFNKCVIKCHASLAAGKLNSMTEDTLCENGCEGKFDATVGKITTPIPACLNPVAVRTFWKGYLDSFSFNGQVYCFGTTTFGDDDTGFVPPDDLTFKCESKFGSNAGKLLKCVSKCHAKRAQQKLPDDATEDMCETDCQTKFDTSNGKLTGCPPCLSPVNMSTFGNNVVSQADSNNGQVYCQP